MTARQFERRRLALADARSVVAELTASIRVDPDGMREIVALVHDARRVYCALCDMEHAIAAHPGWGAPAAEDEAAGEWPAPRQKR